MQKRFRYHKNLALVSTQLREHADASQIIASIKDALLRNNLPPNRCRDQCYDGAANVSGRRSGVATQIQQEEVRAMYLHCMAHS